MLHALIPEHCILQDDDRISIILLGDGRTTHPKHNNNMFAEFLFGKTNNGQQCSLLSLCGRSLVWLALGPPSASFIARITSICLMLFQVGERSIDPFSEIGDEMKMAILNDGINLCLEGHVVSPIWAFEGPARALYPLKAKSFGKVLFCFLNFLLKHLFFYWKQRFYIFVSDLV